jgi:hypothetical protein
MLMGQSANNLVLDWSASAAFNAPGAHLQTG